MFTDQTEDSTFLAEQQTYNLQYNFIIVESHLPPDGASCWNKVAVIFSEALKAEPKASSAWKRGLGKEDRNDFKSKQEFLS